MEDVFIQALITRSYNETDLLDKLPEDVKLMIEEKLSTEVQNNETPELP